jgi:hypothetical protein
VPPYLSVADFMCFLNAFVAGCLEPRILGTAEMDHRTDLTEKWVVSQFEFPAFRYGPRLLASVPIGFPLPLGEHVHQFMQWPDVIRIPLLCRP